MKDLFVPILLVAVAAGGIAWWSLKGDSIRFLQPAGTTAAPQSEAPKPVKAPPPVRSPRKPSQVAAAKPALDSQPAPGPAPAAVAVLAPAPVLPPPFPTVAQIPSGAQEEAIVEQYGEPALSTTTSDHDHVFETLVYTRDRGQFQTLIRVEDGKVQAAYSQTMPPPVNTPISNTPVRH